MLLAVAEDGRSSAIGVDRRVAAAVSGDRRAASALLSELLPRVRNLARYLVRGDADVDDIAQQALIEILRSLPGYRGEGSLAAWADRITSRVAIAHVRRRRAERARVDDAASPELFPVQSGDRPDDYLERRRMARALDALPEEQRSVIVLHHVVGMSLPEVASELSIPFETARSRLRLGMAKVRDELATGGTS